LHLARTKTASLTGLSFLLTLFFNPILSVKAEQFPALYAQPSAQTNTAPLQHRGVLGFFDHLFGRKKNLSTQVNLQVNPQVNPQAIEHSPTQSIPPQTHYMPRPIASLQSTKTPRITTSKIHTALITTPALTLRPEDELVLGHLPDDAQCDPRFISPDDFDHKCLGPFADPALARKILTDKTLRKGDAIMTQRGLVIFAGKTAELHYANQFLPLSQAQFFSADTQDKLNQIQLFAQPNMPASMDVVSALKQSSR
jgi:hypothetical protein